MRGKNIWIVSSRAHIGTRRKWDGLLKVVIQFGGLMGGKAASSFSPLTFVMGIVCFEEEEEEEEVVVVSCILSWKSKECPGRHCLALLDMWRTNTVVPSAVHTLHNTVLIYNAISWT